MQLIKIVHVDHALMPMIAENGMAVNGIKIFAVPQIIIAVVPTRYPNQLTYLIAKSAVRGVGNTLRKNKMADKITYPIGFMQKEIDTDTGRATTKRIMVWINPKSGYHYHKKDANTLCITKYHRLVRLDTIKRRKTFDDDRYIPCPACYGDLRK